MKKYEGVFIFPPASGPEARKEEIKIIEELIKKFKGKIENQEEWGKRILGYHVKKNREGYILILTLSLHPDSVDKLRKALQLEPQVLRFMISKKEEKIEVKKPTNRPTYSAKKPQPAKTH